jgi:hypothetical protein
LAEQRGILSLEPGFLNSPDRYFCYVWVNVAGSGHRACSLDYQRGFSALLPMDGLLTFALGAGQRLVKATDLTSGFVRVYDALTGCLLVGFLGFIPKLLCSLGVIGL